MYIKLQKNMYIIYNKYKVILKEILVLIQIFTIKTIIFK